MDTSPQQPHLFYSLSPPETLSKISATLAYISWQTQCQISSNIQPSKKALSGLCYLCDELSMTLAFLEEALVLDEVYAKLKPDLLRVKNE